MTQAEMLLIEEGWDALVERLGLAEATRFIMLLDRRTGGASRHLRELWTGPLAGQQRRTVGGTEQQPSINPAEA